MTHIACHTDRGPRENLEDVAQGFVLTNTVSPAGDIPLLLLLDGAGGCRGGEIASGTALRELTGELAASFTARVGEPLGPVVAPEAILGRLEAALIRANQTVIHQAAQADELAGMATTAVCGVIVGRMLFLAWVGDSRCYLHSNGTLRQLTRDHSQVQELIEWGLLSKEQAAHHPLAHTITRYLGQTEGFAPEVGVFPLRPGDRVLMCTDGLTDVLSDEQILSCINAFRKPTTSLDQLAVGLVEQAIAAQTRDNVTVLCCEYRPASPDLSALSDATFVGSYRPAVAMKFFQTNETLI
jgi:protein phosphatase